MARPLDVHLEAVEPRRLFEEAAALLRPHVEQAELGLEIEVEESCPRIAGDPALLEQVLSNLILNAIEAAESPGRIVLRASAAGARRVAIQVDDDGPGIPSQLRDDLFKPFVTGRSGGTGLGLALCRKIVEAHGGTVEVGQSDLGGARFVIRLSVA